MSGSGTPRLEDLLVTHRVTIERIAGQLGGGLLRYETAEDLAQGVQLHALRAADRFTYEGEAAFLGWARQVVRRHIAKRQAYWSAQKRNAGAMLRISTGGATRSPDAGIDPSGALTGPSTFAERRERLLLAVQALEVLSDRDRTIVQLVREQRSTDEIATALDLTHAAAEKARARAMERFEKTYTLLSR